MTSCVGCARTACLTPRIAAIVVVCEMLPDGFYTLLPESDYRLCHNDDCDSSPDFVDKAVESHEVARAAAGQWKRAVIIFADGEGLSLHPKRPQVGRA